MTRSPFFNFVLGVVAGASITVMVSSMAIHRMASNVEQRNRAAAAANEERIRQLQDAWQKELAQHDAEAEATLTDRVEHCQTAIEAASAQGVSMTMTGSAFLIDQETHFEVLLTPAVREVDMVIDIRDHRWCIRFEDPESLRRVITALQEAHDKVERRKESLGGNIGRRKNDK